MRFTYWTEPLKVISIINSGAVNSGTIAEVLNDSNCLSNERRTYKETLVAALSSYVTAGNPNPDALWTVTPTRDSVRPDGPGDTRLSANSMP
eukprot:753321-Hanusia_phi.AAC.1